MRNAEATLGAWLDRAAAFADTVIALDDGSTDETRSILESHDLVSRVLANPRRRSYSGWNDRENRQRLIDAVQPTPHSWLMFLDADELLDDADAIALRHLVDVEALPGFAYGFEVFRMLESGQMFDPKGLWVFRLFSGSGPELDLPDQALHFVPVPRSIPRVRWLQTSIRIQHYGSATPARRRHRFEKYAQVDPHDRFSQGYESLLDDPETTRAWRDRASDLPIVLGPRGRFADIHHDTPLLDQPVITAVVIAQDDEQVIERSLSALVTQRIDEAYEVILVGSGGDRTVELSRARYPSVRAVQLPKRVLPGAARNVGLWMANGVYITFPGSHVWLSQDSLQHRKDAHDAGWDMVTCAVENGNHTASGWASYFLDHAGQLPTRESGEYLGAPGHASYITADLRRIGGFPMDMRTGEDTVVNQALFSEGKRTYFCADASFHHSSPSRTLGNLLVHRFKRGQGLGRILSEPMHGAPIREKARLIANLPPRRLRAVNAGMRDAPQRLVDIYRRTHWQVAVGSVASAMGTAVELANRTVSTTNRPSTPMQYPQRRTHPMIAVGGRSGPAATGMLSYGDADCAARNLVALCEMAAIGGDFSPALAPIVTSATVTYEEDGNHTTVLEQSVVHRYLSAVRQLGGDLILQVQPGAATIASAILPWRDLLQEPDVLLMIDLRPSVAFQHSALGESEVRAGLLPTLRPEDLFVIRAESDKESGSPDVEILDMRIVGTPLPHEIRATGTRPRIFLYQ